MGLLAVIINAGAKVAVTHVSGLDLTIIIEAGAQIAAINGSDGFLKGPYIVKCIATFSDKVWVLKFHGAALWRGLAVKLFPAVFNQWCYGFASYSLRPNFDHLDTGNLIAFFGGVLAFALGHFFKLPFFKCGNHVVGAAGQLFK